MRAFSLAAVLLAFTLVVSAGSLEKRAAAYYNPADGGGTMFDDAGNGLGEPLNVIISGLSSPDVLTVSGVTNFAQAIGFSTECLGIHLGNPQSANLGDGHGAVNQTLELRQDYGDATLGTCLESAIGGNHFRVFVQNGPSADSGALFLAVSKEEDASENHTISPDGYDVGRAAVGTTSHGGVTYSTTSETITGLMPAGSAGVNHGISVDGDVILLTVAIQ